MYKKVLFPTDFSAHSEKITGCIAEIPGIQEVVLLHVAEAGSPSKTGTGPGSEIELAEPLLAEYNTIIGNLGLTVQANIEVLVHTAHKGTIGSMVLEKAEKENVSLIVMGARGKSLHDLLLGSVSTYVLYHATIPLLLVKFPPADSMAGPATVPVSPPVFSKILIPTDFSVPAGEILLFVKSLLGIDEIILLHVIDAEKTDAKLPEYIRGGTTKLDRIRDELAGAGFTVKDYVRVGYPPDEINLLAGQEQVTLIAMSPFGEGWRRGLKELVVGSTTYTVVRRADRPVLVVRPVQKD
ncbi:MAG: universal stress protein [Methanomicrobiales archaeon]